MSKWMTIGLYAMAITLLVLMAIAAFYSPAGAWPLSVAAIFCVFLANIDRFTEISASTSGVKATLREARTSIAELKKMIDITSHLQLTLLQQSGRWGPMNEESKEYFLNQIVGLMKDAGITAERITEIKDQAWDRYVLFDYSLSILGGSWTPENASSEMMKKWQALRNFDRIASPEEIEAFLDEVGDSDPKRRRLLQAYKYYCLNRKHMDAEIWNEKDSLERLKVMRH